MHGRIAFVLLTVAGMVASACSPPPASPAAAANTPPQKRATPQAFAVFSKSDLYVAAFEEPVAAPLVPGSTANDSTLRASSPDVVSVNGDGRLVAHRAGTAIIEGSGSKLTVHVLDLGGGLLRARALSMSPGETRSIETASGVPASELRWATSDPDIAVVRDGVVEAAGPGTAKIIASLGDAQETATVTVGRATPGSLALSPASANGKVGRVLRFDLVASTQAAMRATWSSSDAGVLKPLRGGLFVAQAAGKADACVEALAEKRCARVEVMP